MSDIAINKLNKYETYLMETALDWEISAALSKKVGGHSGLVGILLPEFPLSWDNKYDPDNLPARLNDNIQSSYSKLYKWDSVVSSANEITNIVEEAFDARISLKHKINNTRLQKKYNT